MLKGRLKSKFHFFLRCSFFPVVLCVVERVTKPHALHSNVITKYVPEIMNVSFSPLYSFSLPRTPYATRAPFEYSCAQISTQELSGGSIMSAAEKLHLFLLQKLKYTRTTCLKNVQDWFGLKTVEQLYRAAEHRRKRLSLSLNTFRFFNHY